VATKATILDAVRKLCDTDSPPVISKGLAVFLADALKRYSRDRPFEDVEDVTGSAAKLQATPTNWEDQWSVVRKIVYPYSDEDSTVLEADDYEVDSVPVAGSPVQKIRFKSHEPAATETVRIWFTRPHVCSDTVCTVYEEDEEAFAHLVAHVIEKKKASIFLGLKDQAVEVDLVDYGAKSIEARALAKMHLDSYREGIGLSAEGPKPAAVAGDIDVETSSPYVSHLRHHRSRYR
jgi:hypothetical protein